MIKNKEELYKEVLSLLIKHGWKKGDDMSWAKGPPYTLFAAFWRVRHDCGVMEDVWFETLHQMETLIETKYPSRVNIKVVKRYTAQFGQHEDTTYEEVAELLKMETASPSEGRIKFREWF